MSQTCEKCGKKVGFLSELPLVLVDKKILCYKCAEPISAKISALYSIETKAEFELLKDEILKKCHEIYNNSIIEDVEKTIETIYSDTPMGHTEKITSKKKLVDTYMLTTGYDFSGYTITKYIGVVSGQVVLGTSFLSEFSAAFADFFGEQSNLFANKLETAKNAAIEKLITASADKGGNAIIGVDFDYITFHGNMIGVVANGTSVVIQEIKK